MHQVKEKRKVLQHNAGVLSTVPRTHGLHLSHIFKIFMGKVSNPHGSVDTSSWQSSCLCTLDQSQLFDLHFSRPLSNHPGLVFHCAARSIWPPHIFFLGTAPGFSSFFFFFFFLFFCKIRSFQCLPWLRMSCIALTASAHSTRGTVVNNAPAKANKVSRITWAQYKSLREAHIAAAPSI